MESHMLIAAAASYDSTPLKEMEDPAEIMIYIEYVHVV
jgi:hypothetical protein